MTHEERKKCNTLGFPICCESVSLDGKWILVDLVEYLGNGKWSAFDEDGEPLVVDYSTLRKPRIFEYKDEGEDTE